jgi:hypothetical protein
VPQARVDTTATMHWPWFSKPKRAKPPCLHCSLDVGADGASKTVARSLVKGSVRPALLNGEQSVAPRRPPIAPSSLTVATALPSSETAGARAA